MIVWEVEGVALPVEFDAVPVGLLARFGNQVEDMRSHFGDGDIPRSGAPGRSLFGSEDPFGMGLAQCGEFMTRGGGQVGGAQIPEVVVVHADGGHDGNAEFSAAGDEGSVRVFAAFEEGADIFDVVQGAHRVVAPLGRIADHV